MIYGTFNRIRVVPDQHGVSADQPNDGAFHLKAEGETTPFIADMEPERRATAIGVYNFVTGLIYLPASAIAGILWQVHPSLAFLVAGVLSLGAIIAFMLLHPTKCDNKTPRFRG